MAIYKSKSAFAALNTLVVKRSDFSYEDIAKLSNVKKDNNDKSMFGPIDTKVVFVSSSGDTQTVRTNGRLFHYIVDGDPSCLIFGKMDNYWECGDCGEHYPYTNINKHRLLTTDADGVKKHGWVCGNCADEHYYIQENA